MLAKWVGDNLEAFVGMVTLVLSLGGYLLSLWLRRKRVSYRVHLDTAIGVTPHATDMIDVRLTNRKADETVVDPSLALVRIMNTGSTSIKVTDVPRDAPLTLRFAGRTVVDAQIIEVGDGVRAMVDGEWPPVGRAELPLPRIPLNRRDRMKVLVLLSGKPEAAGTKDGVTCTGFVTDGKIVRDTTRGNGPSRRSLVLGGIASTLVGASVVLLLSPLGKSPGAQVACADGDVVLAGSSAFAPVATEIITAYTAQCPEASVRVEGRGSLDGVRELDTLGREDPAQRERRMAMSDDPVAGFPNLKAHPIGVVAFSVVVNKTVGVTQLSRDQVRAVFDGRLTNWRQLGGHDLPISIVSRNSGSGTRQAFETKVLGAQEPAVSSTDCANRSPLAGAAPVLRCERNSTSALLGEVDRIPGAIGYAETTATADYPHVARVRLDGKEPDIDSVVRTGYPFWTVEYFYTYGPPEPGGLVDALIKHMETDATKNILRRSGYVPCVDGALDLRGDLC
ncbi:MULTISPECIES: substrate-binding domain-containing protein [Actinokineospora]|uniref:Phosphate-binding protein n=1 Tax=Actinokineospora fastidiosa TaxID=1816 RepID=A0A918LEJ1_9PSEU|nr:MULTISPECIES: substrate-binding domain-containing protein [Actinokineospora]UVS80864.1 Phosphate-binding protein PstS 1 precursor [Actinokineospora sp. UTMC 2448]GGS37769.1 phosphate-binding protein [Actinokineospora fastidiosa]